jgi:hypothetical protein
MKEVPLPLGLGPVDGYVKKFLPVLSQSACVGLPPASSRMAIDRDSRE